MKIIHKPKVTLKIVFTVTQRQKSQKLQTDMTSFSVIHSLISDFLCAAKWNDYPNITHQNWECHEPHLSHHCVEALQELSQTRWPCRGFEAHPFVHNHTLEQPGLGGSRKLDGSVALRWWQTASSPLPRTLAHDPLGHHSFVIVCPAALSRILEYGGFAAVWLRVCGLSAS